MGERNGGTGFVNGGTHSWRNAWLSKVILQSEVDGGRSNRLGGLNMQEWCVSLLGSHGDLCEGRLHDVVDALDRSSRLTVWGRLMWGPAAVRPPTLPPSADGPVLGGC